MELGVFGRAIATHQLDRTSHCSTRITLLEKMSRYGVGRVEQNAHDLEVRQALVRHKAGRSEPIT